MKLYSDEFAQSATQPMGVCILGGSKWVVGKRNRRFNLKSQDKAAGFLNYAAFALIEMILVLLQYVWLF